jgi:hypothetical protein
MNVIEKADRPRLLDKPSSKRTRVPTAAAKARAAQCVSRIAGDLVGIDEPTPVGSQNPPTGPRDFGADRYWERTVLFPHSRLPP